jgi:hypothetical protein
MKRDCTVSKITLFEPESLQLPAPEKSRKIEEPLLPWCASLCLNTALISAFCMPEAMDF